MAYKYTVVCDTLGFLGYDVLEQPEEILKTIKDAGYDGADLPGAPDRADTKQLRGIMDTLELEVPEVLGAWAYFHGGEDRDLAGDNEEARERGIKYAKKAIATATEPPAFPAGALCLIRANYNLVGRRELHNQFGLVMENHPVGLHASSTLLVNGEKVKLEDRCLKAAQRKKKKKN